MQSIKRALVIALPLLALGAAKAAQASAAAANEKADRMFQRSLRKTSPSS